MKINRIKIFCLAAAALTLAATKAAAQKLDLTLGVEQTERLSTVAAAIISGEELQQTAALSLSDALYGKLSGLNAFQTGGFVADEGRGSNFNIRGYQSFGEAGILILVDGYERPIDRLTVEEVESVTVLKDAAALAMLGHEGVNGAILVKTKRGVEGKTQIKVGYSHKFTFGPEFAEMMDGYGYASALNKARANEGLTPAYDAAALEHFRTGDQPDLYPNVDWRDLSIRNMGSENRANLAVTGGNEKVAYYSMLDYTDSRGLLKDTKQSIWDSQLKLSKANIRTNVDFAVSPTTKMSVNVLGIFMETSRPGNRDANAITAAIYDIPASQFPVRNAAGLWGGDQAKTDNNPVAQIQNTGFTKTHQRQLWADARISQDLSFWLDGLGAFVSAGYDNASIIEEYRTKSFLYGFGAFQGGDTQDDLKYGDAVVSQWRSANAAVGVNYRTSFRADDNFTAQATYNVRNEVRGGRSNSFNRANWIGHVHYDLKDKYIADLTLAANGSNRSYPAKWAFSPVLSLGYIFADGADKALSFGKVRASAGIQHTDYVPAAGLWMEKWDSSAGYFVYGPNFASGWGAFLSNFATTDFRQERAIKFNLGADLRFWNSLDVTTDLYYQKRDHIMLPADIENSYVVGIQSAWSDVGAVRSYGVELSAKYARKINQDLFVNASAMINWGTNRVSKFIGEPTYPLLKTTGTRVNDAIGLEAIGFFADQADIDASPRQEFSQVRPGDVKYKDQNGDNVINQFDFISLDASDYLPELNYAFSLGAEYRGVGVNLVFQGAGNYMQYLGGVNGVWGVMSDNRNLSKDYYANSWDVRGADALYPRLSSEHNPNNEMNSTVWWKKTRFLKLRTAEIYWKLPQRWISHLRMRDVKVYAQGQNLLSIDNVEAMDAELLSTAYPAVKGVNLGLSLTF